MPGFSDNFAGTTRMPSNLFSTYSTGENRVTASVLAVLQSLSLGRIERLLGAIMEQSAFELVRFQNQPAKGGEGVPDALITSSCRLLVETKIKRRQVRLDQLKRHLERLNGATERDCRVLVLTPDERRPDEIEQAGDGRLVWTSFASLDQAIDELLADKTEVVSEREAFLLRELQVMLSAEGLLPREQDVVVVPARDAWPEYNQYHAYVCQPNRPFQPVRRIAFYTAGQIFPLVPEILHIERAVEFRRGAQGGQIGELIEQLLTHTTREEGNSYGVMLLSTPDDPRTLRLKAPIPNDLSTEDGRTAAFRRTSGTCPRRNSERQ